MLQVYRIEHSKTKVGPYQTADIFTQDLAKRAGVNRNLKSPNDDGLYMSFMPYSHVFGCLDIKTLKRWFFLGATMEENDQIILTLKNKGFHMAEFLVCKDDCKISATGIQVAFDHETCRENGLVQFHDLSMLLTESPLVFSIY